MHPEVPLPAAKSPNGRPWWRELSGYHWFVLLVCALGWLFDTMDQQLFNIARRPAITALLSSEPETAAARATVPLLAFIPGDSPAGSLVRTSTSAYLAELPAEQIKASN